MQTEFSVIVYDRVAGIGTALKTDDDIRLFGHHIGDLALAFISPVCAYNCLYHIFPPLYARRDGNAAAKNLI